jgi:glycosyltransferase involved in cell wall biosynthesis
LPLSEMDIGGVEQHILGLARALRKRDHEVRIVRTKKLVQSKLDKLLSIPLGLQSMRDCDILHVHGFMLGAAAFLLRKPTVLTFHGVMQPELETGILPKVSAYLNNAVMAFISKQVQARISISGYARKWVQRRFNVNSEVIPNGIFVNDYRIGTIPHEKPTIIFVGRLVPAKGLKYLIKSIKFISNDFPNVELVIAGSGPEESNLSELVKTLHLRKNVRFVGNLYGEKMTSLYQSADVVVLPSLSETFGIVILEAMASGKPFVGTRVGALPEIVRESHAGYLVPPRDPSALAEKICKLLGDAQLRQRLGRNGRKVVEEKYDWRGIVHRVEKIYGQAIENWRRGREC